MNTKGEFTIYTDGGSRGNPGPGAWAVVLIRPGGPDVEAAGALGETTNNIAEYTALIHGLELAQKHGGKKLLVRSDSELMVRQMQGKYKVKNEGLQPLHRMASELARSFDNVEYQHIRREENKRTDLLCNEVMDGDRDSDTDSVGRSVEREDEPPSAAIPMLDADLTRLIRAWPYLSASIRGAILELLDEE